MKNIIIRLMNGFCYSIAISTMAHFIVIMTGGNSPLLPEYAARFDSEIKAYIVQLLLIGVMSGITSAGTVILELKKPGLLIQSAMYFMVMLVTWIPIACYLWGFHKYKMSMITCLISMCVSYAICWMIQYKICARDIKEINVLLNEK